MLAALHGARKRFRPGPERRVETAFRRIREYALPIEDENIRKLANIGSYVGKTLIIEREWPAGRTTVVLVRTPIGI